MFIKISYSKNDQRRLLLGILLTFAMLDHTRMFFYQWNSNPMDIEHSFWALYLTRFLSHFFAPGVFFLLGIEIFLYGQRSGRLKLNLTLLRTGIFLLLSELFVNNFLYTFDPFYRTIGLFILGLLGLCFISMIGLHYLGRTAILIGSLVLLLGHNILDKIKAEGTSLVDICWSILHQQNFIPTDQRMFIVNYTLLPWLGVLTLGYYFGGFYQADFEPKRRKKILTLVGWLSLALFVCLRFFNVYGDPTSRQFYLDQVHTILSFLNVTKYPASLAFLSLTLGVIFLFLAYTTGVKLRYCKVFQVLAGRPLFVYLFSTFLIHFGAMVFIWLCGGDPTIMVITSESYAVDSPLAHYGYSIGVVYGVCLGVCLWLYYMMKKTPV